jgi:hypothetical protein
MWLADLIRFFGRCSGWPMVGSAAALILNTTELT